MTFASYIIPFLFPLLSCLHPASSLTALASEIEFNFLHKHRSYRRCISNLALAHSTQSLMRVPSPVVHLLHWKALCSLLAVISVSFRRHSHSQFHLSPSRTFFLSDSRRSGTSGLRTGVGKQ